jgi:hypothetical protein
VRSPAVAVLLPVHDQAAFLPRALESLLAQRRAAWEAVVVDDGSRDPDEVGAVVASVATAGRRIRLLRHPVNRGLGATLNAGLDATSAPLVAYLPADDVWFPDHLGVLLDCLADPAVVLARSRPTEDPGTPYAQLVQVAHRRTGDRWTERDELESDDLDRLMWARVAARGPTADAGRVTCSWTCHPGQRSRAIRESFDGGLNVFRSRYRVAEPLRFASTDSGEVDEVARYGRYRARSYPAAPDGLRILIVGELAFNPERVLALAERGHRLTGLWTGDGLGDATVGPLPFGHVPDLDRGRWRDAVREMGPDVIWAQLNWRAVPFAHAVRSAVSGVPFVWHFKEAPQRSIIRGEWPLLADLVTGADACLLATEEERDWFATALHGRADPARLGVLDGDLPLRDRLDGPMSAKLSDDDGHPHTVVLGRPAGLDAAWLVELARRGVHTHLYGQVRAPGPKGAWTAWLDEALTAAPDHVHLHPAVGPENWVRELSRYDAGWLHRFPSDNGGDLRRATWDDLNSPARLPILLAAGLPALQQANPRSVVSVERVLRRDGTGLFYRSADDVAAALSAELAGRGGRTAALAVRERWTFDAHADRLVTVFRSLPRAPGPSRLQAATLLQREEQRQGRRDEHESSRGHDGQGDQGGPGRGGGTDRQVGAQQVRVLGDSPAGDDRRRGAHGQHLEQAGRQPPQQQQGAEPARPGHDHQRKAPAEQAVEEARRIGPEDRDAGQRHHARREGGDPRPEAEVGHQVVLPADPGLRGEEDGRDEGHDDHREHAAEQGRRVDPAAEGVPVPPCGYPARGDTARDGAQEEGHDHRGDGERRTGDPLLVGAHHHLAEGETGAAHDDAQRRQPERDVERRRDRGERRRERRPEHHQAEDQPHVVGLPHRRERLVDEVPGAPAALGAACGQVPEAGPVVRAAEHRVRDHADEQDHGGEGAHAPAPASERARDGP